jgi:hypothetical protein
MENGILVEYKYIDVEQMMEEMNINKKKWVPNNVAEYFFFDEYGFLNLSDKRIQECYLEFTETMRIIYNNTKNYYSKFSSKSLNEEDLEVIDFPRIPPELEL